MSNVPKSPAASEVRAQHAQPAQQAPRTPRAARGPGPRRPAAPPNPVPPIDFPAALPVSARRDEIARAIRDNQVVTALDQCVQRELNFAIVDEVDSILIDEARTPLIISGPTDQTTDLYYRINVMSLELPALRDRRGDVALLVAHFLGGDWEIEDEALKLLERYDWPGNIRQLNNALERAKILADDWLIRVQDLPHDLVAFGSSDSPVPISQTDDLSSIERNKIIEVLRRESGNKSRAARVLGIDRRKLYRLVEKYGIKI